MNSIHLLKLTTMVGISPFLEQHLRDLVVVALLSETTEYNIRILMSLLGQMRLNIMRDSAL